MNAFKLWSQTNPNSVEKLKPDLGIRSWDDLSDDDKHIMWQYLDWHFFNRNKKSEGDGWGNTKSYYEFYGEYGDEKQRKQDVIVYTIAGLNSKYKTKNFAPNFLENAGLSTACMDFVSIFMKQQGDVVLELLSIYCRMLLSQRAKEQPYQKEKESDQDFQERVKEWRYEELDNFAKKVNEVFGDFGINVVLTRQGFVPKQDEKIMEEIYVPTLKVLSDKKWAKVGEYLSEGFTKYREKDYSTSITGTISAIQALLQIIVNGGVGSGDISKLIPQAINKQLIPDDPFTQLIFKNMESVFAKQRKVSGMAHPRIEQPTEQNARLILNLAMVFVQHCLQSN